jgi:hypothetical protein
MIARGTAIVMESVGDSLERVHREVSPAMGDMAIALARRRTRADQLRSWAKTLRRGADDLERVALRMEERS